MDTDRILIRKKLTEIPIADAYFRHFSGIVPAGTENLLVPCDFCRFRPTCPSRQNCAAL